MILFGDGFFTELDDCRIVAVEGRLGAGKTLLGLQLAERYLKRGYRLLTNIRCIWGDRWGDVKMDDKGRVRAVVLLDEGGKYIRSLESVSMLSAYARKLDMYVIITDKRLPHEELTELTVAPMVDLRRNFGLPFWVWRWRVLSSRRYYGGALVESGRTAFYGVYDTVDPGGSAPALVSLVNRYGAELNKRYGYEFELRDVAQGRGSDEFNSALDNMGAAQARIREALAVLGQRKGRRRLR